MKKVWKVFCFIIFVISLLLAFTTLWLRRVWGEISIESLLYTISMPTEGADSALVRSGIMSIAVPVLVLTAIWLILYFVIRKNKKIKRFADVMFSAVPFILLVCAFLYANSRYQLVRFVKNRMEATEIYRNGVYTPPESVKIEGPDTNNLIMIYLESVENSFFSKELGGANDNNCMPELGRLIDENVSFSNTDLYGGPMNFYGTDWSTASYVAHMSGLPLSSLAEYGAHLELEFMPGAFMLGDFLKDSYVQELIIGQDTYFGGIKTLFKGHGDYDICNENYIRQNYTVPSEADGVWGVRDYFTFDTAKERISKLYEKANAQNKKFNVSIVTVDLHGGTYIPCKYCRDDLPTVYQNVYACQSRLVDSFINWCKEQEWYENTTIVITGDHPTMAEQQVKFIPEDYVRTAYNCIINSKVTPVKTKNRVFTRCDMFPTILAAMGFTIEGDRLAFGTNLFSDRQTLTEEYGYSYMQEEAGKVDITFNKKIYHTLVF